MGKRKRERGLWLRFGTITCTKCGGTRLLARECAECGARPEPQEVQYDLQRRARVVAEFRSRRIAADPTAAPNPDELQSDIDRISKRVLRALSDAARSDRVADSLITAFGELDQLVASWKNLRPRPDRNRGRVIGRSLEVFGEGIDLFVDAIIAPDMLSAQELERRGNRLIEEAEAVRDDLNELDDSNVFLSEIAPLESLNRIGRSARQSAGHKSSVRELDAKLTSGVRWESPVGMGLQAHTIQLMALQTFDFEMFTQIVSISDSAAGAGGEELAGSEEWKRCHARASAYLGSAVASVHQVIVSSGSNDFEIVHHAVVAVATWRDGVLKHALATMLASTIEEYRRLVGKPGGYVIRQAALTYPNLLLDDNLTPSLRNAGGHAGVDVDEHGVRIGDDELSMEDFVDRFLAYLETTIATFVGVTSAMARLGADFDCNDYLAPRDRDAAVALFLGIFDLSCEAIEVCADTLIIRATGPAPDWLTLSAALSAMFSTSIPHGKIHVSTEEGEHLFTTSLERFRKYADGIELLDVDQAALKLSAIVAASSLDGASPWSEMEWDRIVKAITSRQETEDLRAWVKSVRDLRGYGLEARQTSVVTACEHALARLRR